MPPFKAKEDLKLKTNTFKNCACSNKLFCSENSIFERVSSQILAMKAVKSIKTFCYLLDHATLLNKNSKLILSTFQNCV